MQKSRVILLFLIAVHFALTGQQFPIRNYNMNDGLSHSNVFRIYQDKKGFLWFCTNYGLCYFDGISFHTVKNDTLLNGPILSMTENKDGTKLLSSNREGIIQLSDSGVHKLKTRGNVVPKYVLYTKKKNNRIWCITRESGRFLYEIHNGQVKNTNGNGMIPPGTFLHKIVEIGDDVFFLSNSGIFMLQDTILKPYLSEIIDENVIDIKQGVDSSLWVSCKNKIINVRNNTITREIQLKSNQLVSNILCDRQNNLWIALYGQGMLLYSNGSLNDITTQLIMHRTLINDMFQDTEGNIWIATYDAGIYKISTLDQINYSLENNDLNIFCRSIESLDNNRFLIGSIGRIFEWNNGKIKKVEFPSLGVDEFIYFVKKIDQKIYIGTPKGLFLAEGSNLTPFRDIIGAISICKTKNSGIWVGGYNNLFYCSQNTAKIDTSSPVIRNKRFNVIYEDQKNNVWMGTSNGLIKFTGNSFVKVDIPRGKNYSIINDILEDSKNRIWLATEGGLLCLKDNKWSIFNTTNGLSHNRCNKLLEDKNGTIWVATLNGLSYIETSTLEIKSYGAGIYPDEVLSLSYRSDGTLFVGTATGLSSIKDTKIKTDNSSPLTYITSIKLAKKTVEMPRRIELDYTDNKIIIDFVGISYQNYNTVEYRYKIQNLSEEWVVTPRNSIELSRLPSGKFTFMLCSRKNKGPWSDPVQLEIIVSTPFWKTWWFIISSLILAIVVISVITWWRVREFQSNKNKELRSKNKELDLLYKMTYLKQQAFGSIINPHFIFNCLNSVQYYLNKNDNEKANAYLGDFGKLIRMTIESAQDTFVNLKNELDRISLYLSLEQLRFGTDLQYEIIIQGEKDLNDLRIPNMLLQPYIENAIWHGLMPKAGVGKVTILFDLKEDSKIRVIIKDDGIGINSGKLNQRPMDAKGLGINITSQRLLLLSKLSNQKYSVTISEVINSQNAIGGTIVELELPSEPLELEKEHYELS